MAHPPQAEEGPVLLEQVPARQAKGDPVTVDVAASRDVDVRAEVIRARLAYEADPVGFAARYADADAELAARIATARAVVPAGGRPGAVVARARCRP